MAVGALLNNWQSWEFQKILSWKIFHNLFFDISKFGLSLEENILRVDRLVEQVNEKGN